MWGSIFDVFMKKAFTWVCEFGSFSRINRFKKGYEKQKFRNSAWNNGIFGDVGNGDHVAYGRGLG